MKKYPMRHKLTIWKNDTINPRKVEAVFINKRHVKEGIDQEYKWATQCVEEFGYPCEVRVRVENRRGETFRLKTRLNSPDNDKQIGDLKWSAKMLMLHGMFADRNGIVHRDFSVSEFLMDLKAKVRKGLTCQMK